MHDVHVEFWIIFVLCLVLLFAALVIIREKLKELAAIRENERKKREREEAEYARRIPAQGQQLIDKHADLVLKFLEIAHRKVSQIDEYGDEQRFRLDKELEVCLSKIAVREHLDDKTMLAIQYHSPIIYNHSLEWVRARLLQLFDEYHERQKQQVSIAADVSSFSGVEFESYLAGILQRHGWKVSGTPATGDQGADLIATKSGRKIVIQAKRHTGSVGNRAVQEVVGAVNFYRATEGYVVTNSTFTSSALALARANNIRLIDGSHLEDLQSL